MGKTTSSSGGKQGLGWMEWLRGWLYVIYEMLFQRISASHLQNPLPLPPLHDLTCIITGSTSGIGLQIARQLAEAGAHVVMAVRNSKAANDLIQKWQSEWSGKGLPLNIEVMELDLLSLDSVARFCEAWNGAISTFALLHFFFSLLYLEPQKFSKDGYEEHMQVNHLAPALLSILLLPSLIRGSPSRIVNVNSVVSSVTILYMHYIGFVDTEDMNVVSGKRKYTSLVGYSSSKLAQVHSKVWHI
ncbi:Dehydrogenase/reductase SDR family member FEY [Vitis vinifera]|uniref:Dehydrogenase/reductase SDR family member FEY n=1 Tax=Vitis vinifera TaxID=29760 RepID=A0A438EXV0_VITVI|nr:Dehydrogenase/reductase SDR family member FEY [Vitis vinifera]